MSLRDILAFIEVSGDGRPVETPALRQAIALACHASAHLSVVIAAAKAPRPFTKFAAGFVAAEASEINERAQGRSEEVGAAVHALCGAAKLDPPIEHVIEEVDKLKRHAERRGRCHDLAVVDQPDAPLDGRGVVLDALLLGSGRPVLVATTAREPIATVKVAAVGWDGSACAARTVGDLVSLFPTLERVDIITITGDKDLTGAASAGELAAHLGRHGVKSEIESIERASDRTVAMTLDTRARQSGCDLLVIGGFARPRWREIVLGGATLDLTRKATVPLLLAH